MPRCTSRASGAAEAGSLRNEESTIHQVFVIAIKGLAGGSLVIVFALLSAGLEPKRFAGLFSAAPAVALAGLTILLLDKGAHQAHQAAVGMLAGGAGMIAYAALAVPLLRRRRASIAALAALGGWLAVTAIVLLPVLLG